MFLRIFYCLILHNTYFFSLFLAFIFNTLFEVDISSREALHIPNELILIIGILRPKISRIPFHDIISFSILWVRLSSTQFFSRFLCDFLQILNYIVALMNILHGLLIRIILCPPILIPLGVPSLVITSSLTRMLNIDGR